MATLADFNLRSLREHFTQVGLNPIHALPVLRAFMETGTCPTLDPALVGRGVIEYLKAHLCGPCSGVLSKTVSSDGTVKMLVGFAGGGMVESVLMPGFRQGLAAGCVSSQIGCAMKCDFCASTKNGFERNLTSGEIVEQYLHLRGQANRLERRLKTLVFMGIGEPMLNLDAVMDAIRSIAEPAINGVGWRQVTVSTVGIVPEIDRLARANLNVHLAVSLHAPDDETRSLLVPSNRRYPVAQIMNAARRFGLLTKRIPTIEYCLLAGVNDSEHQAQLLIDLMENFRGHVNLIPYNPIGVGVSGTTYQRPSIDRIHLFLNLLRQGNVVCHLRDTRGEDIAAACGQLRNHELEILSQ